MDIPLIEFRGVTKRFGDQAVLEGVNLTIFEGQITTIIGLSGAGKSVLLKHMIGLMEPDEGAILFRGSPMAASRKGRAGPAFSRMSYMFQDNALFDSMTVHENVALPLRETTGLGKAEIDRRVTAGLGQMELADAADKFPSELSGGMQKRVALARALVTDPQVILFDEPTSGQDPVRKNAILSMIAHNKKRFGFTAVLVSHEIPDVYFISDRILALYDRSIVFQGSPEELEDFEHPFKDEVIHSLEKLQEELTGLYSRRRFKVLHHSRMEGNASGEAFSVISFALAGLDTVAAHLGYDAAQEVIRDTGLSFDRHFGPLGGISTRRRMNELVTVLPYTNEEDSRAILEKFIEDFKKNMAGNIMAHMRQGTGECAEFSIRAGIALGGPDADIDDIISAAEARQEEIGRVQCP
jgi:phospholipid/cholesterol/gamma-HCH transport system ATP-binding protein